MKIIFNTYPVAFQCPGGGEVQLLKSKEALERRGHEVILFDQWNHSLEDADVVHQFSVQGGIYNFCSYVHGKRIPLVLSPILWLGDQLEQYPLGEIRYLLSVADVICPNSEAEVQRFVKNFDIDSGKYEVTNNGVDSDFFDSVSKNIFLEKFNIKDTFVLCVGNIEGRKNQIGLLEACSRLGLHVVLAGNVRDKEYFQKLQERFSGCFSYIGYLDHDSRLLRSAYSACAVFALPSLLETPGLAALEAAASGTEVVVTKEGCTEEYFGSSAYYVDPNSVEDIMAKLDEAISKPLRTGTLRERVRQFTWDRVGEQLECAYLKARSGLKD